MPHTYARRGALPVPLSLDRAALDGSCWEGRCVASAMTETERRRVCVAIETEHRAEIADIEPAFQVSETVDGGTGGYTRRAV